MVREWRRNPGDCLKMGGNHGFFSRHHLVMKKPSAFWVSDSTRKGAIVDSFTVSGAWERELNLHSLI